jgi:hypothetical protein
MRRRVERGTDGPANQWPRMVARPGSDQLRLCMAWAQPATASFPGVLAVRRRWTLGCGASEVEVFLATDQASGPVVEAAAVVGWLQSSSPRASSNAG